MSNAAIAPVTGAQFTFKSLVAFRISSYIVNLYPVMEETVEVNERAHVFHVNKAALSHRPYLSNCILTL